MAESTDLAHGLDALGVGARIGMSDSIRWRPVVTVEKYHGDDLSVAPYETLTVAGNLLTTAGLNRLTALMIAAGGQAATNTSSRIGVGNSSTAAAVGQTDLQAAAGSANRWFQIMDATFPTQANGLLTWKATFGTADGNFTWSEWCIDIGTPSVTSGNTVNALMLNRAVQALGTKTSAGTWVATATITIS
jgi:hypothetical protein